MLTSPSIPWQTRLQDIPFHFCPTTDAVDAASTNPVDLTYLEGLTDEWSDDEVTISKRLNRSKSATKGKVLDAVLRRLPHNAVPTKPFTYD